MIGYDCHISCVILMVSFGYYCNITWLALVVCGLVYKRHLLGVFMIQFMNMTAIYHCCFHIAISQVVVCVCIELLLAYHMMRYGCRLAYDCHP